MQRRRVASVVAVTVITWWCTVVSPMLVCGQPGGNGGGVGHFGGGNGGGGGGGFDGAEIANEPIEVGIAGIADVQGKLPPPGASMVCCQWPSFYLSCQQAE